MSNNDNIEKQEPVKEIIDSSLSTKTQGVCDYSHAYNVFEGTITIERDDDNKKEIKR